MKTYGMLAAGFAVAALSAGMAVRAAEPAGETLKGTARFKGEVPRMMKPLKIDMSSNADCQKHAAGKTVLSEDAVVTDAGGGIKNVFVYVKKGLEGKKFEAPKEPVTLDQESCLYRPHVLGIMVGQELEILNSDPTLHNIHTKSLKNKEINKPQPANGAPIKDRFSSPEVFVEVKCDVHPWMKAYVGVVGHPYYAITKDDGTFEIKGLPAGEYEIEAKHPKLGAAAQKVKVEAGKPVELNFEFEPKPKK